MELDIIKFKIHFQVILLAIIIRGAAGYVSRNSLYIQTVTAKEQPECRPLADRNQAIYDKQSWPMHSLDALPPAGSDGVKMGDVNNDGLPDLVSGFEEAGVTRIYMHPGPEYAAARWDYVELSSPDVEDAVFIDLDDNGILDVVTASEGSTNSIIFHWAPEAIEDYLDGSQWQSQIVPATEGMTAWMFVVPIDMDGRHGPDIIVGSKRKRGLEGDDQAVIGWLQAPENPKAIETWKYHTLSKAGWIMSIEPVDLDGDHDKDILISDRKFSTGTGVRWLENPGRNSRDFFKEWTSHRIGVERGEPMFLTLADLNNDGLQEILVPDLTQNLKIFEQTGDPLNRWITHTVDYPGWAGSRGKAVAVADVDRDCNSDIILSFEEPGAVASLPFEQYKAQGKYSVIWAAYEDSPFSGNWDFYKISGLKGRKYDLVNIVDLDDDGDLDIATNDENEEGDGLGVVWYENPVIY